MKAKHANAVMMIAIVILVISGLAAAFFIKDNKKDSAAGQNQENITSAKADTLEGEGGLFCTITIRCDAILANMDKLKEGKEGLVPEDGCLLEVKTMEFSQGDTVFDVFQRACTEAGLQVECAYTPAYDSYYVEGINNLYEFDCGGQSGWMYQVNGTFPNYGCSGYELEDGDEIVWCYTCEGSGADIGGSGL